MIPLRQSKSAKVGPDRTHQRMGGQAALFGSALHLQVYHQHQVKRDFKAILSWKPSSFSRGKLRPSSPSCPPQVELDLNSSARSYTENVEQSQTIGKSPMDPWVVLPTEIRGGHWLAAGHTNQGRSWCFLHRNWMVAVDPPVDRWQTSHIHYPLVN
jgi:hypothetical protein